MKNEFFVVAEEVYIKLPHWRAYININYKQIHLGLFKNRQEAIEARQRAERRYGMNL